MRAQLYTRSSCSFCGRARELLERHGIEWTEQSLDGDPALTRRLVALFGRAVMPFVLLDGEPVGGLQDLERLALEGELDGA